MMKLSTIRKTNVNRFLKDKDTVTVKAEFSKFLLKRNGKLYSSLIPQFLKKFSIADSSIEFKMSFYSTT